MDVRHAADWRLMLARCAAALAAQGAEGWLVGGCVRDVLLGQALRDLDVVVAADPLALARSLAQANAAGAVVPLGKRHGAVRVVMPGAAPGAGAGMEARMDLAPLHGGSLLADLGARDFCVNAMAWPLAAHEAFATLSANGASGGASGTRDDAAVLGALVDPLGGLADLRAGRLRAASEMALVDDPVRVLRGARLAAMMGLAPDEATESLMRTAAAALGVAAIERIREEMWGIVASAEAARGLALLRGVGALDVVLPELAIETAHSGSGDAALHALQTVAALPRALDAVAARAPDGRGVELRAWLDAWAARPLAARRPRLWTLRWAALLHGLGTAPQSGGGRGAQDDRARGAFRRMGLAKAERDLAHAVAAEAGQAARMAHEEAPGLLAARRFFARRGDAGVDALLVAVACALADPAPQAALPGEEPALALGADWIARFVWARGEVVAPPLVDGAALIAALGVAPGPEVGRLLAAIRQGQVEGTVKSTDEALDLARKLLAG